MKRDYEPRSLPAVDVVEVVDVSRADPFDKDFFHVATSLPTAQLSAEDTELAARLWRALPRAESMRCHLPPYLVRFYQTRTLIVEASLCWQCNNAFARNTALERIYFHFDGNSEPARELLALLRRTLPVSRDQE